MAADHIETGNVGPGGVAGSGRVEAGEIAGRDAMCQNVNIIFDRLRASGDEAALLATLVWSLHEEQRAEINRLRDLMHTDGLVERVGKLERDIEQVLTALARLQAHPITCPFLEIRNQAGEAASRRREALRLTVQVVIAAALVVIGVVLLWAQLRGGGWL